MASMFGALRAANASCIDALHGIGHATIVVTAAHHKLLFKQQQT
jgi:hypothetical protein